MVSCKKWRVTQNQVVDLHETTKKKKAIIHSGGGGDSRIAMLFCGRVSSPVTIYVLRDLLNCEKNRALEKVGVGSLDASVLLNGGCEDHNTLKGDNGERGFLGGLKEVFLEMEGLVDVELEYADKEGNNLLRKKVKRRDSVGVVVDKVGQIGRQLGVLCDKDGKVDIVDKLMDMEEKDRMVTGGESYKRKL
ncbi:hypothetical protein VNO78_03814 [Psophocarpus tetragonolobus]|uniref:Uncharacterized protein n=1 Tax=Psophocarpus tetragonolobus TaxID=3891 RepID=A0AAN9T3Q7_PSOTE